MKRFNRLLFALSIMIVLSCFCLACGKSSDKQTEELITTDNSNSVDVGDNTDMDELATDTEATTENATETVVVPVDDGSTEEATEDETEISTEETTEEISVADNGSVTFQKVTMQLPEGFEYSPDNSSIDAACFVNSQSEAALILCVDTNNTAYDASDLEVVFDSQIKAIYGENVTHAPKSYNNIEGVEWILDDAEEGTSGRAFAIIDGNMLIYVEFFGYGDQIASYEAAVSSMKY